jgi:hypothetical protein
MKMSISELRRILNSPDELAKLEDIILEEKEITVDDANTIARAMKIENVRERLMIPKGVRIGEEAKSILDKAYGFGPTETVDTVVDVGTGSRTGVNNQDQNSQDNPDTAPLSPANGSGDKSVNEDDAQPQPEEHLEAINTTGVGAQPQPEERLEVINTKGVGAQPQLQSQPQLQLQSQPRAKLGDVGSQENIPESSDDEVLCTLYGIGSEYAEASRRRFSNVFWIGIWKK